jgi:hypothetical protein
MKSLALLSIKLTDSIKKSYLNLCLYPLPLKILHITTKKDTLGKHPVFQQANRSRGSNPPTAIGQELRLPNRETTATQRPKTQPRPSPKITIVCLTRPREEKQANR